MATRRGRSPLALLLALGIVGGACGPTSTSPSPVASGSAASPSSSGPSPTPAPTPTSPPAIGACGGATADQLPWWNDRAAAVVLLTQPGVPFLYYGEEVGLVGDKPDERIRTPMPWQATLPGVGFTTGTPWQPAQDGADTADVATQDGDPAWLLSTYRDLIRLRAAHPALSAAETIVLPTSTPNLLAYLRHAGDETILVVVNFGMTLEGESVDLTVAPCVTDGMTAEVLYGGAEVAPVTGDLGVYVPVPELAPSQGLVIGLG